MILFSIHNDEWKSFQSQHQTGLREPKDDDPVLQNVTDYQKLIGKLIYLTTTRPDVAYTVSCLSQFMHRPLKSHLKTALKVIRLIGKDGLIQEVISVWIALGSSSRKLKDGGLELPSGSSAKRRSGMLTVDGSRHLEGNFVISQISKNLMEDMLHLGGSHNGGTKESIGVGYSSKETGSRQDYILMPLWKDGSPFDSSSKDASMITDNLLMLLDRRMIAVYEGKTHEDLYTCLFACFLSQEESKKVIQAVKDPSWIEAMQEELLQFKLQQVWTLVDLPYGKRAIGTKLFLAYASFKDFVVYQMDVKSAFLYGKIKEEVYVCQPLGFEDPEFPNKVYKVENALYGQHQAPRAWYETLSTYLLDNGFQRGQIDKTLFIKRIKDDILLVQVYVDDIIFGSTKTVLCTEFEKLMHKKFQMSSMGELTFFLRLQVTQKDDGIFISQDTVLFQVTPISLTSSCYWKEIFRLLIMSYPKIGPSSLAPYPKLLKNHQCFTQRLSTLDVTSLLSDFKRPPTLSLHSNAFQINGSDHNVCPNLLPPQSAVCPVLDQILQYASLLKNPFLNSITKWRIWNSAANTKHVPYLKKPYLGVKDSIDIVDFLNGSHIRYALTKNPTIYVSLIKKFWQTATVRIVDNRDQEITAIIDGKEFTITEASVRRHLQLADVDGISVLPTTEIFDQLSLMGYVLLMIKLIFFKKGNFSLSEIFAIPSFMS
ncbi:putative ribonuclease H-like domain-containing protein [Tanacetum coccineum]